MSAATKVSGIILWFDDKFTAAIQSRNVPTRGLWREIFGPRESKLFRLMDISIEIACTYEDALKSLDYWAQPEHAGTYVHAVVDLNLPQAVGKPPAMIYGIKLGRELRKRGIPFVFLSADTEATQTLDKMSLGTVPYYVKEPGMGEWRMPDSLSGYLLDEISHNVSWLSLKDVLDNMHPESSPSPESLRRKDGGAFLYFPYFTVFKKFVNKWENDKRIEFPRVFAVRTARANNDLCIQQSLSIIFHELFLSKPKSIRMVYRTPGDDESGDDLLMGPYVKDPDTIFVLRIEPENTSVGTVKDILDRDCSGTLVLVLPNDESCDRYTEVLRENRVASLEALPSISWGDSDAREELAKHSCSLVFLQRKGGGEASLHTRLHKGWLSFPELLINPINWIALLESETVVEELSDPYEVVAELNKSLRRASKEQQTALAEAIDNEVPVRYEHLLRVGNDILSRDDLRDVYASWVERALDFWLCSSWQFPYGVVRRFILCHYGKDYQKSWTPDKRRQWEENSYEVLCGLCAEYERVRPYEENSSGLRQDLQRVCRFIKELGGAKILSEVRTEVNWELVESMRWPHHRYPMPSAINTCLRRAGRHLWIQTEGMDLAAALPAGRRRYRALGDIASYYSDVLNWAKEIVNDLPLGWRESIDYLVTTLREYRVVDVWQKGRSKKSKEKQDEFWYHLLGLLRNGAPVMFVADQTIREKTLATGRTSARPFLSSVNGYGKILERLRRSRRDRMMHYSLAEMRSRLVPTLEDLSHFGNMFREIVASMGDQAKGKGLELSNTLIGLFQSVADDFDSLGAKGDDRLDLSKTGIMNFLLNSPHEAFASDGWFWEGLDKKLATNPQARLNSLVGTKIDHIWQIVDAVTCLNFATYHYRYFDGYHLLGSIFDLRLLNKDTAPRVSLATINTVMGLFVAGLEGLIAHLSWCLTLAGEEERAERILPPTVQMKPRDGFTAPDRKELEQVLTAADRKEGYAVYTLGIPGRNTVNRLCYHGGGGIEVLNTPERAGKTVNKVKKQKEAEG